MPPADCQAVSGTPSLKSNEAPNFLARAAGAVNTPAHARITRRILGAVACSVNTVDVRLEVDARAARDAVIEVARPPLGYGSPARCGALVVASILPWADLPLDVDAIEIRALIPCLETLVLHGGVRGRARALDVASPVAAEAAVLALASCVAPLRRSGLAAGRVVEAPNHSIALVGAGGDFIPCLETLVLHGGVRGRARALDVASPVAAEAAVLALASCVAPLRRPGLA